MANFVIFCSKRFCILLTSFPLVSPLSNHSTVTLFVSTFIPDTTAECIRPENKIQWTMFKGKMIVQNKISNRCNSHLDICWFKFVQTLPSKLFDHSFCLLEFWKQILARLSIQFSRIVIGHVMPPKSNHYLKSDWQHQLENFSFQ